MENGEFRVSFAHTHYIIWCGCAAINSQFSILNYYNLEVLPLWAVAV